MTTVIHIKQILRNICCNSLASPKTYIDIFGFIHSIIETC